MSLELTAEARACLEAEATRRGVMLGQLVTELAERLPTGQDRPAGTLDEFFGSGDSGVPSWASRDIHELRADVERRRQW